jgi:hypothetical protein
MKPDAPRGGRVDAALARAKAATAELEPPPDFADRVLGATKARRKSGWTQLDALGRRAVTVAALAAAAAMALAWYAEAPPDAAGSLDDVEEVVP